MDRTGAVAGIALYAVRRFVDDEAVAANRRCLLAQLLNHDVRAVRQRITLLDLYEPHFDEGPLRRTRDEDLHARRVSRSHRAGGRIQRGVRDGVPASSKAQGDSEEPFHFAARDT